MTEKKINPFALKSALSNSLTSVRFEFDINNKQLFDFLFQEVVEGVIPHDSDRRTKEAKLKAQRLKAFKEAARELVKDMN